MAILFVALIFAFSAVGQSSQGPNRRFRNGGGGGGGGGGGDDYWPPPGPGFYPFGPPPVSPYFPVFAVNPNDAPPVGQGFGYFNHNRGYWAPAEYNGADQARAAELQAQAAQRQAEAMQRQAEARQRQIDLQIAAAERQAEAAQRQRELAQQQAERHAEAAERQREMAQRQAERQREYAQRQAELGQREREAAAAQRQKDYEQRMKEADQRRAEAEQLNAGNSYGLPGFVGNFGGPGNWPGNFNHVGVGNGINGPSGVINGPFGSFINGQPVSDGNIGGNNNNNNFVNFNGFNNGQSQMVWGNGQLGTEDRLIGQFSGVSLMHGSIILQLSQSTPTGKVRLHGETNILPLFDVAVQPNGLLTIRSKSNVGYSTRFPIKAYASSSTLAYLEAAGSSEIQMATALTANSVSINAQGSARIAIPSGRVETLSIDAQGSANFEAFGLDAGRVTVKAAGSARVKVTASKFLSVIASGSASVLYRGSPQLGPMSKTGSASIAQAN